MRFALSFSGMLLVLVVLLLAFGGREVAPSGLVLRAASHADAVLRDTDFVEAGEMAPFPGRLPRVQGLELTQEENGHVRMTVTIEEVVREEGRPRLRNVVARIYDEPSAEDLERRRRPLRATLHSRFVDGEPSTLLRHKKGNPLPVRMDGAVLKDERGRVRFDVPHIDLDAERRTGHTTERVSYRDPDRKLTLQGTGLRGGLDLREVHILKAVHATFPLRNATASFRTPGEVTVRELDAGLLRVETAGAASVEHPLFAADCGGLVVHLEGAAEGDEGGYTPSVLFAQDGIDIRFDPKEAAGLAHARADLARVEDETVYLEGNLTARRTGPFELFGEGNHTVEFKAPKGVIEGLDPEQKDQEVRFRFDGGVEARQVGGPGILKAGSVRGEAQGTDRGVLLAEQDVSCNTRDFALRADSLRASRDGEGAELIELGGEKQVRYRLDKPIELQGEPRTGDLVIECRGPLTLRATGKGQFLLARDGVVMVLETPPRKGRTGRELTRLTCNELVVRAVDGNVVSLTAEGAVVLADAPSQTVVRCRRLFYSEKDGGLTLLGDPARIASTVEEDTRFKLSAQRIVMGPEGKWFRASDSVVVAGALPTGATAPGQPTTGRWIVRAKGEVHGVLGGTGPNGIKTLTATEEVRATGPHGQALSGDKIHYVAAESEVVLTGRPASIRDGDMVGLSAPKFELGLDGRDITRAATSGAGSFFYRPQSEGSIREWTARLQGSALFENGKLTLADGVVMDGFDRNGRRLARITAPIVIAQMPRGAPDKDGSRGPLRLEKITGAGNADKPVVFEGETNDGPMRIISRSVSFEPGPGKVTLRGSVEVDSEASPHKSIFEWISFILTEEGVDEIEFGPTTILKRKPD